MFGISFTEITLILIVALIVVGPAKLPGMLRTLGSWLGAARRFTTQVRAQTGIDELLREEGIASDLNELRGMLKGGIAHSTLAGTAVAAPQADPYLDAMEFDVTREYPIEGADAMGALPDDLADDLESPSTESECSKVVETRE